MINHCSSLVVRVLFLKLSKPNRKRSFLQQLGNIMVIFALFARTDTLCPRYKASAVPPARRKPLSAGNCISWLSCFQTVGDTTSRYSSGKGSITLQGVEHYFGQSTTFRRQQVRRVLQQFSYSSQAIEAFGFNNVFQIAPVKYAGEYCFGLGVPVGLQWIGIPEQVTRKRRSVHAGRYDLRP